MSTNRRSLRFVTISLAIISVVTLGVAANWTGVSAFSFFAPSETAAEALPVGTTAPAAPLTVLIDPAGAGGFESGIDLVANGWTPVNGATNGWFVGTATFASGAQSAYISNTSGATYTYTNTTATVSHFYRDVTVPAGEGNITLSFKLKGDGDLFSTTFFDKMMVYTAPTSFTPTTAAPTSSGTALAGATLVYAQNANFGAAYTTQTVNLPASLAGTTFRLIFTFHCDNSTGAVPSSVDDISLVSVPLVPVIGTKTIPGDYPSVTAAITDLNTNGTGGGGVTFNLTNGGTYIEDLPCITAEGTAGNPIIFKKTGVGANAIIAPTGTVGTTDAGVCIQGGDFVTFDGVDIAAQSNLVEYGYLVKNISATNGAQNDTIKNTSITLNRANIASIAILQSATTTGGGVAPTALSGSNFGNKYYNFTIQNSYTGVFLSGTAAFPDDLNEVGVTGTVTKNVIGGNFVGDIGGTISTNVIYGVRALSQSNAKIFNNEIKNLQSGSTGTVAGIHIDNSGAVTAVSLGTTQVYNNEIHDLNSVSATAGIVSGIRANLTGNAGSVSKIYNNFIYNLQSSSTVTTSRRLIGIVVQDIGVGTGATHNVHYNSVRIAQDNLAGLNSCFEIGGAAATNPTYDIRNNIFANFTGAQTVAAAKHYAWASTSNTSVGAAAGTVSDFNVLHINNPVNGFVGRGSSSDFADLAAWQAMQAGAGPDDNSKSQNPRFISPTNLHINPAVPSPVENNGTPIATTTTVDFDNDARTGNTDIGADEGTFTTLLANDIEATTINTPVNGSSFAIGAAITPQAVFSNVGSANQASVSVQMTITGPGGYSYAPASQAIAPFNAGASSTQTFPVAPAFTTAGTYTATATNLFADSNAANDSFVSTFTVSAPITGGTVSVGAGQAYTSLTNPGGIFETINNSVVASSITVNVTSDLTNETGAISLNQFAVGPTLLIQASGGPRTISGNGNGTLLINLNGADNVTFSGTASGPFGLTIRNTNPNSGGVFRFIGDASSNTITSCIIEQNNSNNTAIFYSTGTTTGNDNNSLTNSIVRGANPSLAPFNSIATIGTSAAISNGNLSISGNQITNFGQAAVLTSTGTDGFTISGNDISQTASRSIQSIALFISVATGTNTISGNRVHGLTSNSASATVGMVVVNGGTVNASRNRFYDFQTSPGATGVLEAIEYDGVSGGTTVLTLTNNFVSLAPTVTTVQTVIGIQDFAFSGNTFTSDHNSVYLGGTAGGAGISWACRRGTAAPTNHTARNNICFNNRTGGTNSHFAGGDGTANGAGTYVSNGNFFAGTGATPANFMDYGTSGTGTPVSFAAWQTGPPARDANSFGGVAESAGFIASDIFVNPAAGDLHIKSTAGLIINGGIAGTGVVTDIDGDTRPQGPGNDIGADELLIADLSITKTDGVTTATPGGSVTYTITASNAGPSNVTGATVADTFPASLTATWTCVGAGGGTCTAAGSGNINDTVNLPAGGSVTYTASATISASATGSLTNTATVSSTVSDPDPANNSATDTDTLTPSADLAITKTDGVTTATPGGSVTYTITASNAGPSNVTGATVADTFPAVLTATWTCVGAGGGTCTAAGSGNINDTVNLPAGGSVTYTASATISASATGSLSNTATVSSTVSDSNPANNSATDTDTLTPSADLAITKTDGVTTVTAGGSVTYTITASNSGPSNAVGATVADTFPASLTATWTCVGAGGGTCTAAGSGNINDTVNLPVGGSVTYTASATISASATGSLSNTATVAAPGGVIDPNPGNNSATDTDTIGAQADLSITKTDGVSQYLPGGTLTYTITASNAGPSNATGATVADTFPVTLTGVTWTCAGAGGGTCTAAGSGNINDTVNLPVGGSVTYTATTTVSAGATGSLSNTATVTAPGGVIDPNLANNTATDTDSNSPASIQFSASIYREDESQTATIMITRTIDTSGSSSVTFSTVAGGTATVGTCGTLGVDYQATTQTINFGPGATQMPASVVICGGDTQNESSPDETINLALSNPSGAGLGSPSTATLNINDTASQWLSGVTPHDPIDMLIGQAASPYPSQINVTGGPTIVGSMRVTLYDVWHFNPDNMDVLLVGPNNAKYVLVADTGGAMPVQPDGAVTLTFRDTATTTVPDSGPWTTGQFLPTSCGTPVSDFPVGAPAGPYIEPGCDAPRSLSETMFGAFGLSNPVGIWKLFVRDDNGFRPIENSPETVVGQIRGGWGLEFIAPTAGEVSMSGRVTTTDGRGITNAADNGDGGSLTAPIMVNTQRSGGYAINGLQAGETYVVTVMSRRFTFEQPSRVITLSDNATGVDFVAYASR